MYDTLILEAAAMKICRTVEKYVNLSQRVPMADNIIEQAEALNIHWKGMR